MRPINLSAGNWGGITQSISRREDPLPKSHLDCVELPGFLHAMDKSTRISRRRLYRSRSTRIYFFKNLFLTAFEAWCKMSFSELRKASDKLRHSRSRGARPPTVFTFIGSSTDPADFLPFAKDNVLLPATYILTHSTSWVLCSSAALFFKRFSNIFCHTPHESVPNRLLYRSLCFFILFRDRFLRF